MIDRNKETVTRLIEEGSGFVSDIAMNMQMSEAGVLAILKADRHRFKRTGFWTLNGISADPEWALTRIFYAELFGRKTVPRVR